LIGSIMFQYIQVERRYEIFFKWFMKVLKK